MRRWIILGGALLSLLPVTTSAADEALARLTERANACIKSNAAEVERNSSSLVGAAEFLVRYLCAREISVRETYRNNARLLEALRQQYGNPVDVTASEDAGQTPEQLRRFAQNMAKMKAAYEAAKIDPDTGEMILPPDTSFSQGWTIFPPIAARTDDSDDAPNNFRALAARAVLDARLARLRSEGHP